ncbi:MAG: hypothetical protein IAE82_10590 [Opitutaceae bacterium]|nr:hypothetical protein [Opitutaceae bacterium]
MNRVGRSSLGALAAAGLTLGCLYWIDQRRAGEAGALRSEIAGLRARAAAREPVAPPAMAATPGGGVSVATPAPTAAPATPPPPLPIYRNEGRATARAALQTLAWASDRGDVTTVQAMLVFDDAARTKAEQLFSSMPPEARGSWRSVDDMAASLITMSGMQAPFPAADVLEHIELEPLSPERARLHLRGTRRDGLEFQRTSTGWSYVISEVMVDRYIQQQAAGR